MKITSFIYQRKAIKKILNHLGIFEAQESKRAPPLPPKKCFETVIEPYVDGWPEYEEPSIDVQTL